jgi:tetratricopeptide (TPR) repeat protein
MASPKPAEVRVQLRRICSYGKFRGRKAKRLLAFLVKESIAQRGSKLRLQYIAEALKDEPLTFEKDTQKWGYPKTRANLAHVRKRLREYYETKGYYDPVIIKLNPGSYAPVIAYNPASTGIPSLEPFVERLILRAKTALDARILGGAWRAFRYYLQIPFNTENPRQTANILFIPMASASIIPGAAAAVRPDAEVTIAHVRASGVEPWECTFAEACCEACYKHNWQKSLDLFELAIANSQGEATYYWWYTALLASQGRTQQAISILDSAVRHFSRTNIATRTDLALLQIMAATLQKPRKPCQRRLILQRQIIR